MKEKSLESCRAGTIYTTLKQAVDAVDAVKGTHVFIITRVSQGWITFRYACGPLKPAFDEFIIGGLPLGGDPIAPQTYVVVGRKRFAKITNTDWTYKLTEIDRPENEPSGVWKVNAIVPVEEVNHGGNLRWLPRVTVMPTVHELQATMTWIDKELPNNTKIKAGGSRHAWSRVAVSSDVYIAPDELKLLHLLDDEPDVYRHDIGERGSNLVRGGSGNLIREANRFLWIHQKSFPALGGYDGQTLGGMFNTGTHGSVFTRGALADHIVSIDLVLGDGSVVRLEPKDGVTDPSAIAREGLKMRLVQDDNFSMLP